MKQKGTKILVILIAIILVAGAIVTFTKGLAFELKYQDNKKIEINIGKQFDEKDIKEISEEIFGKQPIMVQAIEIYKDALSLTTTNITEDQKTQLITKINEKYETEIDASKIEVEEVAHVRGRDIIKPYIVPFVVTTIIILVYLMIRYNKLNVAEVLTQSIGIIVLAQLVLLALMAITRMPIGKFTIPTILLVYMLSTYICTSKFDGKLEKVLEKQNKK